MPDGKQATNQSPITPVQTGKEQELEAKLGEIQAKHLEEEAILRSQKSGVPYIDLKTFPVDTGTVAMIDEEAARRAKVAAVASKAGVMSIVVNDPDNPEAKSIIKSFEDRGLVCKVFVVSEIGLAKAWARYKYAKERKAEVSGMVKIDESAIDALEQQINSLKDLKDRIVSISITQLLDMLIAGALKINASDIHFEAKETNIRLRYRLDGMLTDVVDFSPTGYPNLLSRIKLVSGMKLNIHDKPQDGRFTIRRKDLDIEVRVSILPGPNGENIVMRILDPRTIQQNLEDMGMRPDTLRTMNEMLKKTTGSILTTGPTGSGKTTTLYAFIRKINAPDLKIITIEDPVEYHVKGVQQTQVDPEAGYTFANGLRAIVRQDPDVILVGEIRDKETADIAMQAALTGHLVFSTIHTNSAAGTVPRLIDLGVRPQTIGPAVNAMMAQRLLRRLCSKCKKKQLIKKEDYDLLKKYLTDVPMEIIKEIDIPKISENMEIYYPAGCAECNDTGYKGRVGVYEIILMDKDLDKLIAQMPSISQVEELAVKKGMISLLKDGFLRVLSGITSVEEVLRIIGE
ncbi:MAG: type IV pilus assembly protein PilB [Parcubacteria group bacterium Licking1014_17]|nr:MAG: type IV pilus assembly protein PilB [Parcubacteria group bacterium Licking1014_17]